MHSKLSLAQPSQTLAPGHRLLGRRQAPLRGHAAAQLQPGEARRAQPAELRVFDGRDREHAEELEPGRGRGGHASDARGETASGALAPGERRSTPPPVRSGGRARGVAAGVIVTRRGSGIFVSDSGSPLARRVAMRPRGRNTRLDVRVRPCIRVERSEMVQSSASVMLTPQSCLMLQQAQLVFLGAFDAS